jgi:site-specific DNA-adenine methylase
MKKNLIKFLPSYVGSKAYWVDKLAEYKGNDFIEVFSGSAVLSANLAKTAILNDTDPVINKIFSNYTKLIVPEKFTKEDYYTYRKDKNWWKYIYCLQKMSFSGVFRYSKNGFNVPMKNDLKKDFINVKDEYAKAKKRFKELNPTVLNKNYGDLDLKLFKDKVVIFDPPYEGSQAAYNKKFDYVTYWDFVSKVSKIAKTTLIFDTQSNLEKAGYKVIATRKMRVNGSKEGDVEALAIVGLNLLS